jgi:hypothetical protein
MNNVHVQSKRLGYVQQFYNLQYSHIIKAEFLHEIQTKVLRVFLLAIHSHLYSFALRFLFLQTHATSYSFYSSVTVHCKGKNVPPSLWFKKPVQKPQV